MKDIFISTALESIQNMFKMKTYAPLKQSWKIGDCLLQVRNVKSITALTKLRHSDHTIIIEKGIENAHFVQRMLKTNFKCPVYKFLRKSLCIDDIHVSCIGFFYPLDERFLVFW